MTVKRKWIDIPEANQTDRNRDNRLLPPIYCTPIRYCFRKETAEEYAPRIEQEVEFRRKSEFIPKRRC